MSLIFALGFLAFTIISLEGVKDSKEYHNDTSGIAVMGIATIISILAMIGCIFLFIFVELPLYGIVIWNVWTLFN